MGAALAGLLALWVAARGVDGASLVTAFQGVGWWWVAGAVLLNAVNVVTQGWAWRLGLRSGDVGDVPLRHAIAATWIGKAGNQLLPAKIGEVARVAVIRRHAPAREGQLPRIIGSLVAQRVFALVATFLVVVVTALVLPIPVAIPGGRTAPLLGLLVLAAVAAGLWRMRAGERVCRRLPVRVRGLVERLARGAGALRPGREAARILALHVVAIAAQLGTMALLLHAFSIAAPVTAPLMIIVLVAIAGAVPSAPGGLGVNQAAIVLPLGASYGVSASSAFAFSLGLQATVGVVAVIGGLVALAHQRAAHPRLEPAAA